MKNNLDDSFYLDPLIDRYKNPYWSSDYALFNEECGELKRNFTDGFFELWKETVDNWDKIMSEDGKSTLVKDGKILGDCYSVLEFVQNYQNAKKVINAYKEIDRQKKYLEDNKDLYTIIDFGGAYGRTSLYINSLLPKEYSDEIKEHIVKVTNQDFTPFLYRVGENVITFEEFFEDLKKAWKEYYPEAVKVIIRKNSLKRFFGVTDINPQGGFYCDFDRSYNGVFEDSSIRYFFLCKDGKVIGY